uniref:Uncharacterized protein n=1 Tax=Anguilla anguilla TaxID=7936 RepID=A0A0E9Q4P6_ANGAN
MCETLCSTCVHFSIYALDQVCLMAYLLLPHCL